MLFKSRVTVILDVGSYAISAYAVDLSTGSVLHKTVCEYEGYSHGQWFEPDKVGDTIDYAISETLDALNARARAVYIGVPGEFSELKVEKIVKDYPDGHRITDRDIAAICDEGDNFKNAEYVTISCSPVSYLLDGQRLSKDPRGSYAHQLEVVNSYMLCKSSFISAFSRIAGAYTRNYVFISSCWAEAISLLPADKRDCDALICDIGYLSTSVMLLRGDGLVKLKSISTGGAYVAADLMNVLKIPYKSALELKPYIDFSIRMKAGDTYTASDSYGERTFDARLVKDIAEARIEEIADAVRGIISSFGAECKPYLKVYLTGEGIAEMRGVKNVLSGVIGRSVEIIQPDLPGYNKPAYASLDGLITVARRENR